MSRFPHRHLALLAVLTFPGCMQKPFRVQCLVGPPTGFSSLTYSFRKTSGVPHTATVADAQDGVTDGKVTLTGNDVPGISEFAEGSGIVVKTDFTPVSSYNVYGSLLASLTPSQMAAVSALPSNVLSLPQFVEDPPTPGFSTVTLINVPAFVDQGLSYQVGQIQTVVNGGVPGTNAFTVKRLPLPFPLPVDAFLDPIFVQSLPSFTGSMTVKGDVQLDFSATEGTRLYGTGTPGCSGTHLVGTNEHPAIASPGFQLQFTNVQPNALALGMVTDAADFAGTDLLGAGFLLHVDLLGSTQLHGLDVFGNGVGFGTAAAPIPSAPVLIGKTFYAQSLSANWLPACSSPFGISTSPGFEFTIR